MSNKKECIVTNARFSYRMEVDDETIEFQGFDSAQYFMSHYDSLGYKVKYEVVEEEDDEQFKTS